jgi:hypothetical protein
MTQDLSKYIIGLNDGQQGESGFIGSLLLRDPDYQRGMQIGAAQATLKAVKSAEQSQRASDEGIRTALASLANLIGAGQAAMVDRLDEQIAMEKAKNMLSDVEPYLVTQLAFDDEWFAGKSVALLKAEREQYVGLGAGLAALYEKIGRIPRLAPGGQAIAKLISAYDICLQPEIQKLAGACGAAVHRAAKAFFRAKVSALVVGVALDAVSLLEGDEENWGRLRTYLIPQTLFGADVTRGASEMVQDHWYREQTDEARLDGVRSSIAMFRSWADDPKKAPKALAPLRDTLQRYDDISGHVSAVDGADSLLLTLLQDGVDDYCAAVAEVAARHLDELESRAGGDVAIERARRINEAQLKGDLEKLEGLLNQFKTGRLNQFGLVHYSSEIAQGPSGDDIVRVLGASPKRAFRRMKSADVLMKRVGWGVVGAFVLAGANSIFDITYTVGFWLDWAVLSSIVVVVTAGSWSQTSQDLARYLACVKAAHLDSALEADVEDPKPKEWRWSDTPNEARK